LATQNLTVLGAVMSVLHADIMTSQFRRDVPLLNLLQVVPGAGKNLSWTVKFPTRSAGGAYAEGADMSGSDFDYDTPVDAVLSWAQYRAGAKVSGLARAAAASYGGNVALYGGSSDPMNDELKDAITKVVNDYAADMYAGDPGASPIEVAGAALAIDSSGTFAGIAPGSYASWASGEATVAATSLTKDWMRKNLVRPVKDAIGRAPEFVTVPGNLWDIVAGLFEDDSEGVKQVMTSAAGMVDITTFGGGTAYVLDGNTAFIEDRHCTANTMYSWHSEFVRVRQLPDADVSSVPPAVLAAALAEITGSAIPVSAVEARLRKMSTTLTPQIIALGKTGDSVSAAVQLYAQMEWRRRNAFSKALVTGL